MKTWVTLCSTQVTRFILIMENLIGPELFNSLKTHHKRLAQIRLQTLFDQNPERFKQFSFELNSTLFDLSKHFLTQETLDLLLQFAHQQKLSHKIQDLFAGKLVNFTEQRPALHMALRTPRTNNTLIGNLTFQFEAQNELDRCLTFAENIRHHTLRGFSGKPFTDVIQIGVGGSCLGPKLLCQAFDDASSPFQFHFISELDGQTLTHLLTRLNPETSLFIIASKTFTTLETMLNAEAAKKWLIQNTSQGEHYQRHFVGISANASAMNLFGIAPDNQFYIWDAIGGRYSICSTMSLIAAIGYGAHMFRDFLRGAYDMDVHFKETSLERNIPVLFGLLDIWYRNFFEFNSLAILPYSSLLSFLPAYLQQLFMESLGKSTNELNQTITYNTGALIWGDVGFTGQHAFFQLLHQGTQTIPCEFIVPVHEQNVPADFHGHSLANALAQAQTLMLGQTKEAQVLTTEAHRHHPGNRPSSFILFDQLTPYTLGQLLAFYEHRVYVLACLWKINSFDQFGVELGKTRAKQLLSTKPAISKTSTAPEDPSTRGLLGFAHRDRKNFQDTP